MNILLKPGRRVSERLGNTPQASESMKGSVCVVLMQVDQKRRNTLHLQKIPQTARLASNRRD